MKKIIFLLPLLLLFSCKNEEKKVLFIPNPKYDVGELIYMKPDSSVGYVWL